MTRMDAVLEVAPADRLAVVQPGVVNKALRDAVAGSGLFYPPDPSSYDWCTIGGNLSTNSGGLCCVKYGVTTDYVLGLEVVLADGRVLRTGRRTVKGVAGYDLARLFVGSEGTLGVITEATLALRPAPKQPVTLAATFATTAQAGQVVERVVTSGPRAQPARDHGQHLHLRGRRPAARPTSTAGARALLVAQSDAGGAAAAEEIAALTAAVRGGRRGLRALHRRPGRGRTCCSPPAGWPCPRWSRSVARCSSTTSPCPGPASPRFLDGCDAIAAERDVTIGVVGHAGDGNMHPTVVLRPGRRRPAGPRLRRLRRHPRAGAVPRRHDHRRARGRQHQGRLAGARDRAGRPRRAPGDQGRARPGRPAQPRQGVPPRRPRADLAAVGGLAAGLTCPDAAPDDTLTP